MSPRENQPKNRNPPVTLPLDIREHANGVTFSVLVLPRSKENRIVGISEGALKVKVTAPPVEGAANEALIKLLAQTLRVRKSHLEILKMKTSPRKLIQCRGLTLKEFESRLKNNSSRKN